MKVKHKTLIFLAGIVWLIIGTFLMTLGILFLMQTLNNPNLTQVAGRFSIASYIAKFNVQPAQGIIWIITGALLVGYFKGRMVLAKSVKRQINRINSLPNPAHLKLLYSKGYYLLIASMILLGVLLRFCPITIDTRGAVDVAIGAALINGAMLYFRYLTRFAYTRN